MPGFGAMLGSGLLLEKFPHLQSAWGTYLYPKSHFPLLHLSREPSVCSYYYLCISVIGVLLSSSFPLGHITKLTAASKPQHCPQRPVGASTNLSMK